MEKALAAHGCACGGYEVVWRGEGGFEGGEEEQEHPRWVVQGVGESAVGGPGQWERLLFWAWGAREPVGWGLELKEAPSETQRPHVRWCWSQGRVLGGRVPMCPETLLVAFVLVSTPL